MGGLPITYTPAEVARRMGWNERAVRKRARELGACHVLGKTMILTDDDVSQLVDHFDPGRKRREALAAILAEGAQRYEAASKPKRGFIYFLVHHDRLKIGFATKVENRIRDIRAMSPVDLDLVCNYPGTWWEEQALHAHFAHLRKRGEWFAIDMELVDLTCEPPIRPLATQVGPTAIVAAKNNG